MRIGRLSLRIFSLPYVLASTDDPFQKDDQASLLGYVNVLLKRRWLLFLIFLAATGSAYVASRLQPREYEATATFLVSEKSSTEVMGEKGQVFLSLKSPVEYFKKIAISARILDELLQIKFNHPETGSPATLWEIWKIDTESEAEKAYLGREALRSRIELTNEGNSPNIMTLTVTAGSPQLAAPLANSLVKLLGLYDVDLKTQHARERVTFIQAQVKAREHQLREAERDLETFLGHNTLRSAPRIKAQEERLQREVEVYSQVFISLKNELELARITEQREASAISLIDKAIPPRTHSRPRTRLNVAFAAVLGLILGIGLTCILEYMSNLGLESKESQEFQRILQDMKGDLRRLTLLGKKPKVKTAPSPLSQESPKYP